MKYFSTNDRSHRVSLREAVLRGMPEDRGLYMPEKIVEMDTSFFKNIYKMSFSQIAIRVADHLIGDDIEKGVLNSIVKNSIDFDAPLVEIEDRISSLELFHGPTLAFKDFGARFMSRLMAHFNRNSGEKLHILAATSGDTGSAVANGFHNIEGIEVHILYPSGKVSEIQEKQLTTLDGNVTAFEVDGTFDDCQRIVKEAFADRELTGKLKLTSANSINIARLIPQTFYYFYAYSRVLTEKRERVVISVPSGNFGNLTAGLMAKKMGLPISKFIASTNVNDVVPEYLKTGIFLPRASKQTVSNAMDVGNPSNFVRMLSLYEGDLSSINRDVTGYRFTDVETLKAIGDVAEKTRYTMDPHGAVAYLGLKKFMEKEPVSAGIFLETAHPAKFIESVKEASGLEIVVPERLEKCFGQEKKSIKISNRYDDFKEAIITL